MNDMNKVEFDKLREEGWRRKLSQTEKAQLQAFLAVHPEAEVDFAEDAQLTRALAKLPDAPVSSNFTALVLQTVERDQAKPRAKESFPFSQLLRLNWFSRIALTCFFLGIGFLSFQQHQTIKRAELAQSVETVSNVATLPRVEWLEDFEAISRLDKVAPPVDDELLAALSN